MLRTLRIRRLVIIEDLTVEFGPGLNLLTGETGAGKSILVDALGLVAGERADRKLVRSGEETAVVEALFEIEPRGGIAAWCRGLGLLDQEDRELVVRREISTSGTNRIRVNGSPCSLAILRDLGGRLVELHGQHEHQSLLQPERHLELLDRLGGHAPQLQRVAQAFAAHGEAFEALDELRTAEEQRMTRIEELERAVGEVDAVQPRAGELAELDTQRRVLQNAARMGELLDELVTRTYEGEAAAASVASAGARWAEELAGFDPELEEPARRLAAAALELADLGSAFREYRERRDLDPEGLERVEERRVAIERLCLRYGKDEEEVLGYRAAAAEELERLKRIDAELRSAEQRLDECAAAYLRGAAALSRARRAAGKKLAPAMRTQFKEIALGKAELSAQLTAARGPRVALDGETPLPLTPRGAERVEFLFTANPGEPARPLNKVASGGELSRIMLALRAVVDPEEDERALVFDEVDAGVGGAVADALGARLARVARRQQVLCVTHLPQVAAYAQRHFSVRKQTLGGRTVAEVTDLSSEERVEELARMLGGKRQTDASRRHATELLAAARPG